MIPTCPHTTRPQFALTRYDAELKRWTPRRYCGQCCGPIDERGEVSFYQPRREKPVHWKANGR